MTEIFKLGDEIKARFLKSGDLIDRGGHMIHIDHNLGIGPDGRVRLYGVDIEANNWPVPFTLHPELMVPLYTEIADERHV